MEALVWVGLALVLFLCGVLALGFGVLKDQRDALRLEVAEAEERLAAAQAELATAGTKITTLTSTGADIIPKVGWRKARLMNKPEFLLFCDLERLIARAPSGHRLFTQVSCGEFLDVAYRAVLEEIAKDAFHCLNRKRVDFLIIDRVGMPVFAIEYQGSGHYQGNAHDRDHAKRVACHAAGVRFMEVPPEGLTPGQKRDLYDLLAPPAGLAAE